MVFGKAGPETPVPRSHRRQTTENCSELPDGRAVVTPEMLSYFHPESKHQVQDNRRPESQERGVNKIKPDAAGREVEFFPQSGTNSEDLIFQEITKWYHIGCPEFRRAI